MLSQLVLRDISVRKAHENSVLVKHFVFECFFDALTRTRNCWHINA